MPCPRVTINGEMYVVRRYETDRESRSGNQELLLRRSSDGNLNEAEFVYKQGRIRLFLQKEA